MSLYDSIVAIHVVANVSAFGVLLAWPLLPAGTVGVHRARARVLGRVVTWSATLGLVLGVYLASDRELWNEPWVQGPMAILVLLLGIVGGYLTPAERRLGALSERADPAAFAAAKRPVDRVATLCFLLAAVATFLMVVKPGA